MTDKLIFFPPSNKLKHPKHKKEGVTQPPVNTDIFFKQHYTHQNLIIRSSSKKYTFFL